jgi:hypothetical protein
MALADVELAPFSYAVDGASLTVTGCPADVVIVNPDPDTLPTVPKDPPAAGPDRALPPPPANPGPLVLHLVLSEVRSCIDCQFAT